MSARRSLATAVAACSLLGCLGATALVVWAAWNGKPLAVGDLLYINPARYLTLAAVCFLTAALAWSARQGARAVKRMVARLIMLLLSLGLSMAAAELTFRVYLSRHLAAGSFENFRRMRERGERMPIRSASPLAAIIEPADNPRLIYRMLPNLNLQFGHHQLRTNQAGMRDDRDYPPERLPHSVRILGLGDSGMFGWQVDQGQDYLDVLQATLAARGDGVTYETLNTGTPGYNTRLEVELLKDRGLAYRPDIVILGWCANDFFLPHFFLKETPMPKRRLLLYDLAFDREGYVRDLGGPVISDREAAHGADGKVDLDQVPEGLRSDTEMAGVAAALSELKQLGAQHGFKLLVFGPLKPDILGLVKQLQLDYCNTLEKIKPTDYPHEWEVHAMHPRVEGHRVLGDLLAKELAARGWLKPAP